MSALTTPATATSNDLAPGMFARDGKVFCNSRQVAGRFGKQNKDVNKAIRNLIESGAPERNFAPNEIRDLTGASVADYDLTRDGFTLLVMGFTGEEAMPFKLAYIAKFNEMEDMLRHGAPKTKRIRRPSVLSVFRSGREIARLAGFDETQASLRAARYCEKKCGENPLELMGITYQPAAAQVTYLLATEIGERLGLGSGRVAAMAANRAMLRHGYQEKDARDRWQPTAKGIPFAKLDETNRKHSSGTAQAWHWHPDLVPALRSDLDAEKATGPFARTPEAVS